MRRPRSPGAALVTLLALVAGVGPHAALEPPAFVEEFAAFRQSRADGAYVDWFEGRAGIQGRSTNYQDLKLKPYRLEAEQMALTEGRSKLLDYLRMISIDGSRRVGEDSEAFGRVRALLERTQPGASEVSLPFGMRVPIKISLFGPAGLLGAVLGQPGGGPSAEPSSPPASPPAPSPADAAGVGVPAGEGAAQGTTGLVVDASGLTEFAPALLPKIVDEAGHVVYGQETVDPNQLLLQGMAAYALKVEVRERSPQRPPPETRQGDRPLRVKAIAAAGPGNVWAVVSSADAGRILEAAAASPFLMNCKVLILAPPAGMRQSIPPTPVPLRRTPPKPAAPGKER